MHTTNIFKMEVTIENEGAAGELALLPSDRATKKALMEQTAKIFAERLGADNVVVTSIQQFISREDDAQEG